MRPVADVSRWLLLLLSSLLSASGRLSGGCCGCGRVGWHDGGGGDVPGEVLMALAQFAGQTVAQAAITDVWEAVRGRFARLLGRGDARKTEVAEQWLDQTRKQLTAAPGV